jgi:hypothetical protein
MLGNLRYTGMINQAFAKVYVILAGAAITLWSLAMLAEKARARALSIYGIVLGVVLFVAIALDELPLDIHGFGAVTLGTGVWFVAAGIGLIRAQRATETGELASHARTA